MSNGARRLKRSEQISADARYELLVRLAAGGMGAVFVGVARGTAGPLYAIKRAHAHLAEDSDFRHMFVAEARLASRIRCAHAVGVIDVDESEGEILMVMPYVEGGSFSDMLVASSERGRRIAPQVTLRIIVDAARGLDGAHRLADDHGQPLGIVHRDVSPHNILVSLEGTASIVDFGVAKAVSIDLTKTATGVLKGKSAYMAPEYLKGRVANAQTDVFGLAIVAWEALANRRLFKGADETETVMRVLAPAPAPMLTDIVSLDATVAAVIARALAKDPTKRFGSASDFADSLERAARAAAALASPVEVGAAVKSLLGRDLEERRVLLMEALAQRSVSSSGVVQRASAQLPAATPSGELLASSPASDALAVTMAVPSPSALGATNPMSPPVPAGLRGTAPMRTIAGGADPPVLAANAFDARPTTRHVLESAQARPPAPTGTATSALYVTAPTTFIPTKKAASSAGVATSGLEASRGASRPSARARTLVAVPLVAIALGAAVAVGFHALRESPSPSPAAGAPDLEAAPPAAASTRPAESPLATSPTLASATAASSASATEPVVDSPIASGAASASAAPQPSTSSRSGPPPGRPWSPRPPAPDDATFRPKANPY